MGRGQNLASPKPVKHSAPPCPAGAAEMTAESKNGLGKRDVKQGVQLLHTEYAAQTHFLAPHAKRRVSTGWLHRAGAPQDCEDSRQFPKTF